MKKISFNPLMVTKKMLSGLEVRPRDVLEKRFGLNNLSPRTLESIGQEYNITRERVRQIESFSLNKIRRAGFYSDFLDFFAELKSHIHERGGLVREDDFLNSLSKKEEQKPHLLFLLVLGDDFYKIREDNHFHHSWTIDQERAESIRKALLSLCNEFDDETVFQERDLVSALGKYLRDYLEESAEEEILLSLLRVSKKIQSNSLGEWGLFSSPYIRPRGMKDYAFLVMRKHGSPMHFTETSKLIKQFFGKPAHVQTVHNELIKDDRFVLVGRGLYALKEWGYEGGVVRNVIQKILSEPGLLPKEEIIKRVLKERYVKENTILVNLQNKKYFKKDEEGNYTLV